MKTGEAEFGGVQLRYLDGKPQFLRSKWLGMNSEWTTVDASKTTRVYLERRTRRRDKRTIVEYFIGLETAGQKVEFGEITGDTHGIAEGIAKFLDLGMVDRSRGKVVERAAGTLDHSLRQQAATTGSTLYLPHRPESSVVRLRVSEETAIFDIPGREPEAKGLTTIVGSVVALCVMCSLMMMAFSVFLGLVGLGGSVFVGYWVRKSVYDHWATPATVSVSPEFLRFQSGDKPETEFAAHEIEELASVRMAMTDVASRMVLRSDRGSAAVELRGGHDSNDWIAATVRYLLSEQPERIDWATLRSWSSPGL